MKILSAVAAMIFLVAVRATAETTNALSDAEIQGRNLAQKLLEQQPAENFTNNGILQIRDGKGNHLYLPISCEVSVTPKGLEYPTAVSWSVFYKVKLATNTNLIEVLCILNGLTNNYLAFITETNNVFYELGFPVGNFLSEKEIMSPFVSSDFWVCDLGLEFFHWPQQKILPKPTNLVRGREYTLLESTNPNPSTNGYSRVLSWIDKDSGGILEAEAYDAQGKLLKVFEPKSFKKVNGQWELQEMEIRNVQTGSRTRLEFDLNKQ